MKPYLTTLPADSLISKALDRIDYEDAFALKIQSRKPIDPAELVVIFFHSFPTWFKGLMAIRETIAGWIGLKTADRQSVEKQLRDFKGEPGESIALFHVLERTEEEVLTGENDSHLDFRLSFFSKPLGEELYEIALVTTVQFNNWVGKTYFLPVKPVHRLIVPIVLKRMAKELERRMGIDD